MPITVTENLNYLAGDNYPFANKEIYNFGSQFGVDVWGGMSGAYALRQPQILSSLVGKNVKIEVYIHQNTGTGGAVYLMAGFVQYELRSSSVTLPVGQWHTLDEGMILATDYLSMISYGMFSLAIITAFRFTEVLPAKVRTIAGGLINNSLISKGVIA